MVRFLLTGACMVLLSAPVQAYRVTQLVQIPAEPGQWVVDLKTDSQGNLVVAAAVPLPDSYALGSYAMIKKIDTAGNELFSLALPGASNPRIAVDNRDDIYVAGSAGTPAAFPFTRKLAAYGEGAFAMKLSGADGTILYSTSWGGALPRGIAVAGNGELIVAGSGLLSAMPLTPGAYASPANGLTAATYVVRFSAAGDQVLFSARYGGQTINCNGSACMTSRDTSANQVVLDRLGNIWIAGNTNTTDLPTTPDALKSSCGCLPWAYSGFFAEFSSDGTRLLYGSYLGTSPEGSNPGANDGLSSAAFDAAGHLWMAGYTSGTNFPATTNALQSSLAGGVDGFVTEYDPAADHLIFASYFGGAGDDLITTLQTTANGTVLLAGHSSSTALPAAVSGFTRGTDFVATLDPASYTITGLTRFPNGGAGAGLALAPAGFVLCGTSNVAAMVQEGDDPLPSLYAVVNSAGTAVTGQVAPGELISLYGANLGPVVPVGADFSTGFAPATLGGVQVLVDGAPIPLLWAQADQINAIVPFGILGAKPIAISRGGALSNAALLGTEIASPEVFKGVLLTAAALNEDGTINGDSNRAQPGSIISVFAAGFGAMNPPPADGQILTWALPSLTLPVEVQTFPLNGPVEVISAGPVAGTPAGVIQVMFRLPAVNLIPQASFTVVVGGWRSGEFTVSVEPSSAPQVQRAPDSYRNAIVLMPEISNRLRHRRFLQATLSSSSTM